jgi:replication protein CRI
MKLRTRGPKLLATRNSAVKVRLKSLNAGAEIWAEASVAKVLQQHNVFGSNNLRKLCPAFFRRIADALGVEVSEHDKLAWEKGDYRLRRVDIAETFRLPIGVSTPEVVRAIAQRLLDRGVHVSVYRGWSSVYRNQMSRFQSLKAYDKRKELVRQPLPQEIEERKKILKLASRTIRVELVLRSTSLGREKQWGKAWSGGTARSLLYKAIGNAKLSQASVQIMPSKVERQVPLRLRPVVRLWALRQDLRHLYHRRSLQRHQKVLGKHIGDVLIPPGNSECRHIKLNRILRRQQQLANCPQWAKGKRIFFNPKKNT